MLRAAVIDRQKEKREMICSALMGFNMDIVAKDFSNEYDFKESLDEGATSFDIIILNTTIYREGDGVELASYVRKRNLKVMICFATDTQRYYAEAFTVFATGYLLYPFDMGELYNCISFFYQKTETERRASWMIKEKGGNYKRIFCRHIVYVESSNREIIIHLEDGSEIVSYAKLNKAEEELPSKLFLRCHQSYIISLYFVEELERNTFYIQGAEIPISKKYQKLARDVYYEYIFDKI